MKIIKFSINENYYDRLKDVCETEDITVKRKINILLSQDTDTSNIRQVFPLDYNENLKSITLKINEELYKGIMKKCGKLDIRVNKYVPYLIYKYLLSGKTES